MNYFIMNYKLYLR